MYNEAKYKFYLLISLRIAEIFPNDCFWDLAEDYVFLIWPPGT